MLDALSTPGNMNRSILCFGFFCALLIAAGVVGIDDNLPGILLAYGAAVALILAFVHPRRSARKFRHLLYGSVFAFGVFVILHNFFEAVVTATEATSALKVFSQGLAVASFLVAALICPPAILVSLVASAMLFVRNRRRPTPSRDEAA